MVPLRALTLLVLAAALGCERDAPAGGDPSAGSGREPADSPPAAPGPPPREAVGLEPSPARRPLATPIPWKADDPAVDAARDILHRVVREHALDPANGWTLTHALLALGPEARLPGGVPIVDHLFRRFAVRDDGGHPAFPKTHDGQRVESHPELVLKVLAGAGVEPGRPVVVEGEDTTVAALWRGALARAWLEGPTPSWGFWSASGWALEGVAAWAPPGARWRADGREVSLDALADAAHAALREETALLQGLRREGRTPSRRALGQAGRLRIMGHTCGGAHFIQGVVYAFARGFGDARARARLGEEVSTHLWRLSWELPELDGYARRFPTLRPQLLVQRLKFLGHLLETAHGAAALGVFDPTAAEREALGDAARQLVATVHTMQRAGWFDRLAGLRDEPTPAVPQVTTNAQLFLDTVGDAAHALRGLDLARGRARVLR